MPDISPPEGVKPQPAPRRKWVIPALVVAAALVLIIIVVVAVQVSIAEKLDNEYYACIAGKGFWDIGLGGGVAESQGELEAISAACQLRVYG